VGVLVSTGVSVDGILVVVGDGVVVGGSDVCVAVGGTSVAVGGNGVLVDSRTICVALAGTDVTGVAVGCVGIWVGVAFPQAVTRITSTSKLVVFIKCLNM
jgi:hypothetical protein